MDPTALAALLLLLRVLLTTGALVRRASPVLLAPTLRLNPRKQLFSPLSAPACPSFYF